MLKCKSSSALGEIFTYVWCRRIGLPIGRRIVRVDFVLCTEGKQIENILQAKLMHCLIFIELPALKVLEDFTNAVFFHAFFHLGRPQ